MHGFVIVHVFDSKCARVHVCCACLFVRLCVCLAACIIHAHNSCFLLIFSHCPVQSGKKCLETRFVIVLVCSNRSRCFASALTDHSSTLLFSHHQGPCRQSKLRCNEHMLMSICCVLSQNSLIFIDIHEHMLCHEQCSCFNSLILQNAREEAYRTCMRMRDLCKRI